MVMKPDSQIFAKKWIEAWNSRDLERILSHYSDDLEITSEMIREFTGSGTGTLFGKPMVRNYWRQALEKLPDLHFELLDVAELPESIAIYYISVMDRKAVEVMYFDKAGKICKVVVNYY